MNSLFESLLCCFRRFHGRVTRSERVSSMSHIQNRRVQSLRPSRGFLSKFRIWMIFISYIVIKIRHFWKYLYVHRWQCTTWILPCSEVNRSMTWATNKLMGCTYSILEKKILITKCTLQYQGTAPLMYMYILVFEIDIWETICTKKPA